MDGSLARLAKEAGKYSRFKKDKILNLKFEKMYELWMNKSLKRELANEVLIHQNEKINGMITVKKNDEAIISLISVKSDMKNKGIGTQLLKGVENWSIDLNLKNISVATQQENFKACAFYEKNNFIVREKIYIYHFWKKNIMIPFNKPYLTGNENYYLKEAVSKGKISGNGYFTKLCQNFFDDKLKNKINLCTTSCTDALEMSAYWQILRQEMR